MGAEAPEGRFGKAAIGGDLTAEYRQHGGAIGGGVQLQHIIARRFLGAGGPVVVKRANPGIRPHHLIGPHGLDEIFADRRTEISNLLGRGAHRSRCLGEVAIGGADQGEIVLVRDHEHHPAVFVLESVAMIFGIQPGNDDVAALDQPYLAGGVDANHLAQNLGNPGTGGVDQSAGVQNMARAVARILDHDRP